MEDTQEGKGKYEVRHYTKDDKYKSSFTNSWFIFIKLRLTNKVIYTKVLY